MKSNQLNIIGAGLSGLIAAHAWPRAQVFESSPAPEQGHKALLRFRTDKVSALTGIPFRRVQVRKGVWSQGAFVQPNIALANAYSIKCLGRLSGERSVWNVDPVERFIVPDNFYAQLIEHVGARITWNSPVELASLRGNPENPIVSTVPLDAMCAALGVAAPEMHRAAITVSRFRIKDCDVHQTVYFPDATTDVYRASITGDVLIVESMHPVWSAELADVSEAFGLRSDKLVVLGEHRQNFGKIAPIDARLRKELLFQLTSEHGIFSLGRFAQHRNILLDDVVHDIEVIKGLIFNASRYELRARAR